jgi:hypothetical protein
MLPSVQVSGVLWSGIHVLWILATCLALGSGTAMAKEPTLNERVSTFKKALRNTRDPKARSRAFGYLRGANEPAVIDHITWGLKTVTAESVKIRRAQATVEKGYEKLIDDLHDANMALDASSRTSRDMNRYNKAVGKISKAQDSARMRQKNLENDFTRNKGMFTEAILVAAELLEKLEGLAFNEALGLITAQWLHAKAMESRMRWFDAVSEVTEPAVTQALHQIVADAALETVLRVRAIDALAARSDGTMFGKALEYLKLPPEQQPLIFAAIRLLRRMHDRRGIVPLMGFLDRLDVKRARTDAQLALVSMTGVDHGPHSGQWRRWWEDKEKTFIMPKQAKAPGDVKGPEKGKTFYGVHTFSDKILYIVDISGSMDKLEKGKGAGGKTKMAVLKQELTGAVFNLNATDTFNVIFFNHQVIPWQRSKVVATERNKNLLKKWVADQPPLGGTNIFDALEMGFRIAHRVTGPPDIDTIFFLTDGKPTAGKFQDKEKILELMKAWNEQSHLTIHTIGIGKDHDADFLTRLAQIGDGTYVKR